MKRERSGIEIEFEPRDIWVGLYVKRTFWVGSVATKEDIESDHVSDAGEYRWDLYICILPMLPVHIWFPGGKEPEGWMRH